MKNTPQQNIHRRNSLSFSPLPLSISLTPPSPPFLPSLYYPILSLSLFLHFSLSLCVQIINLQNKGFLLISTSSDFPTNNFYLSLSHFNIFFLTVLLCYCLQISRSLVYLPPPSRGSLYLLLIYSYCL